MGKESVGAILSSDIKRPLRPFSGRFAGLEIFELINHVYTGSGKANLGASLVRQGADFGGGGGCDGLWERLHTQLDFQVASRL
jgi:hypothetical protein